MAHLSDRDLDRHGIQKSSADWFNWSGTVRATPREKRIPGSEEELARIVRDARGVRVVGAGHSFSPVVHTDETLISLDELRGLVRVDGDLATIRAGSRLRPLGDLLHARELGLLNQGDIDHQSLAGAVSTGTHGTGVALPCVSGLVTRMKLVLADGETLAISETENSELLEGARVSLGLLGVLSEITMRCGPAYRLAEHVRVEHLDDILPSMRALREQHRHAELFVFPFGRTAIVKTLDPTEAPADTFGVASGWSDDILLFAASQISRGLPSLNVRIQKALKTFVTEERRVGRSSHIFPNERRVRFAEMEYQVPLEVAEDTLLEVVDAMVRADIACAFPLEFRYVAGDDGWLSPFHGGPRASISVHQFHRVDPRPLFAVVEPILQRRGGRPHWGKMHTMKARELAPLYPAWDEFHALRRRLDPGGKFLSRALTPWFVEEGRS